MILVHEKLRFRKVRTWLVNWLVAKMKWNLVDNIGLRDHTWRNTDVTM